MNALYAFVDSGGTDAVFATLLKVLQLAAGGKAYKNAWRLPDRTCLVKISAAG